MKKCSHCQKNPAMVLIETVDPQTNEKKDKMFCLTCAEKLGYISFEGMQSRFNDMIQQFPDMFDNIDLPEHLLQNGMFSAEMVEEIFGSAGTDDSDPDYSVEEMLADADSDPFEEDDVQGEDYISDSSDATPRAAASVANVKRKNKKFRVLRKFGESLIDKARLGEVDEIIGREKEIDRMVQILNRRQKNNPLLIGEPGVGKTAIAEGLAVRVVHGQVPEKLLDVEIFLLDMTAVVAGTQFRGQFEQRMKEIIKEATMAGNVILVIDEVHNIMGAGEVHGGVMNAANILKPALAKGAIQIIGATTLDEYRKHIEKDAALERRFQTVRVEETTIDETIEIIDGIKKYYEDYHKVKISTPVIEAAVRMSARYITDRFLPDKAIDVIDEAGSRVNLLNRGLIEQRDVMKKFDSLVAAHAEASNKGDYAKAAELRSQFLRLKNRLDELDKENKDVEISVADVAHVVESWTGIPVNKLTQQEADRLIHLEEKLHERVISQKQAVSAIARSIRRNRSGFKRRKKPSSFIFAGPTGVGKTELAKAIAEELFGNEDALVRLDMSEYMEKHTVSKLIGAPPGYVGHESGGQLTEVIRRKPYSVILMDEIEKAHPDIFNLLLQILDDGRLTDSQGRTVFFENSVIIMTSNLGNSMGSKSIGFSSDSQQQKVSTHVLRKIEEMFRPEFINRIDEIAVFEALTKEDLRLILDLQLREVLRDMEEKNMSLEISEGLKKYLLHEGFDPKYGARPLRRLIQKVLEDEMAERYIRHEIKEGDHLRASLEGDRAVITKID